jgi:uncharacterized OB-fold protein
MASGNCLTCGNIVDYSAEVCPKCGKKNPLETLGDSIRGVILSLIIVSAIFYVVLYDVWPD